MVWWKSQNPEPSALSLMRGQEGLCIGQPRATGDQAVSPALACSKEAVENVLLEREGLSPVWLQVN